jgi:hypothetical protein
VTALGDAYVSPFSDGGSNPPASTNIMRESTARGALFVFLGEVCGAWRCQSVGMSEFVGRAGYE